VTMTREQLEAVIERQLFTQHAPRSTADISVPINASARVILAAVDDWAAGQVAAAITPPARQPRDADALRSAAAVLTRRSGPGRPNLVTDILIRVLSKAADRFDTTGGTR
jgi:hypothetical protein